MAETDSLREVAHAPTPFSTWLGVILLFLAFGAIVLALIGPAPRTNDYEATRAKKRFDNLKTLREEDAKALTTYAYVDKQKGTVHIPIERAMELTVAELKDKKPIPAGPIATPAAEPAAPAAAPSAAPSTPPKNAASPSPTVFPPSRTSSNTASTPAPHAVEAEGQKSEIRGQPAGAANPPNATAGSQPGPSKAAPMASPAGASGRPAVSPTATPNQKAPGTPLPVPGASASPTP